jgi:hypothetical protein
MARFSELSPQFPSLEERLMITARLRPQACFPARTARSNVNGPSHPDAPDGRPEYQFGPPRSGIQPTGYHHSRSTRRSGRVVLRLSTRLAVDAKRPRGQGPVPQLRNVVTTQSERDGTNDSKQNSRPALDGLSPVGSTSSHGSWAFASSIRVIHSMCLA